MSRALATEYPHQAPVLHRFVHSCGYVQQGALCLRFQDNMHEEEHIMEWRRLLCPSPPYPHRQHAHTDHPIIMETFSPRRFG